MATHTVTKVPSHRRPDGTGYSSDGDPGVKSVTMSDEEYQKKFRDVTVSAKDTHFGGSVAAIEELMSEALCSASEESRRKHSQTLDEFASAGSVDQGLGVLQDKWKRISSRSADGTAPSKDMKRASRYKKNGAWNIQEEEMEHMLSKALFSDDEEYRKERLEYLSDFTTSTNVRADLKPLQDKWASVISRNADGTESTVEEKRAKWNMMSSAQYPGATATDAPIRKKNWKVKEFEDMIDNALFSEKEAVRTELSRQLDDFAVSDDVIERLKDLQAKWRFISRRHEDGRIASEDDRIARWNMLSSAQPSDAIQSTSATASSDAASVSGTPTVSTQGGASRTKPPTLAPDGSPWIRFQDHDAVIRTLASSESIPATDSTAAPSTDNGPNGNSGATLSRAEMNKVFSSIAEKFGQRMAEKYTLTAASEVASTAQSAGASSMSAMSATATQPFISVA